METVEGRKEAKIKWVVRGEAGRWGERGGKILGQSVW